MGIPDRLKKHWFVTFDGEVTRIEELSNEFEDYDPKTKIVVLKNGVNHKAYKDFSDACIDSLHIKYDTKRVEWNLYADLCLKVNKEMDSIKADLEKLLQLKKSREKSAKEEEKDDPDTYQEY